MSATQSFKCRCPVWRPDDASLAQYQYPPLQEGDDIRVLRLEPGSLADPLQYSLQPLSFESDFQKYEALSYTWGDGSKTHALATVSHTVVGITSNLHSALHHLRIEDRAIYVWIDAVCIDQQNVVERNKQVLKMGEIYSKALLVDAWIGDEDEDTEDAFELIDGYESAKAESEQATQKFIDSLKNRYEEPCRMAFWKLLDRPWFKRMWIIQEVVLAQKVVVFCGDFYCSWNGLVSFVATLGQHGLTGFLGTAGGKWLLSIGIVRDNFYRSPGGLELGYVLGKTRSFQSTVPHDRIYGLAALLKEEDLKYLEVNYELPVAEFYTSVVINFRRQNFDLLSMGGYFSSMSLMTLPTWGCDWSVPIGDKDPFPLILLTYDSGKPFSCGKAGFKNTAFEMPESVLVVTGYEFDSIVELQANGLVDMMPSASPDGQMPFDVKDVDYQRLWPQVEFMEKFAQKSLPYPAGLELSSVSPRLLVCDQGLDDGVVPSESYFQLSYRLMEVSMSRVQASGQLDQARKADKNVQELVGEVARSENPADIVMQAIGYGAGIGGLNGSRKLCLTRGRYLGLVPLSAESGDVVAIFNGAKLPFVLRPRLESTAESYTFMGECYIHGIMYGEAIEKADLEEQVFRIY